jgi:carbon storage regulator
MLVLTREVGEFMLIGDSIEIRVLRVDGDQVRIGIVAPRHISIKRGELIEDIRAETATAARPEEKIVANIAAQIKAAGKGAAPKT